MTELRQRNVNTALLLIISVMMTLNLAVLGVIWNRQDTVIEGSAITSADVIRLQEQVTSIQAQIRENMDDRYRRSDARDDFAARDRERNREHDEIKSRLLALENKQRAARDQ